MSELALVMMSSIDSAVPFFTTSLGSLVVQSPCFGSLFVFGLVWGFGWVVGGVWCVGVVGGWG